MLISQNLSQRKRSDLGQLTALDVTKLKKVRILKVSFIWGQTHISNTFSRLWELIQQFSCSKYKLASSLGFHFPHGNKVGFLPNSRGGDAQHW